jgi:hypothetical protein
MKGGSEPKWELLEGGIKEPRPLAEELEACPGSRSHWRTPDEEALTIDVHHLGRVWRVFSGFLFRVFLSFEFSFFSSVSLSCVFVSGVFVLWGPHSGFRLPAFPPSCAGGALPSFILFPCGFLKTGGLPPPFLPLEPTSNLPIHIHTIIQ